MKHELQVETRRPDGTLDVATVNTEPSMTQQQWKDDTDINNIMAKYATTGEFRHVTSKEGIYADFSQITDYQEMLHVVKYAEDAFMSLPAQTRKRFDNDPGQLLDFIQNPENLDEAVSLGLVNKPLPVAVHVDPLPISPTPPLKA